MTIPTSTNYGDKFFLVWNPAHGVPTFAHETLSSAREEAARLASLNPGKNFHVLESIGTVRKIECEWADAKAKPLDTPF